MVAAGRTEGLERIDWLLTTIDWLLRYDAAAVKLRPDGELGRLVAELERAHAAGDATARERARAAYDALLGAGLREAMQMYPAQDEHDGRIRHAGHDQRQGVCGAAATDRTAAPIDPALPELKPENPVAPDEPPRIVMRSPSSTAKPGEPLTVRAAVLSGQPLRSVAVHYRSWGAEPWTVVPMQPLFRRTYEAALPAEALTRGGLEFFVSAEDDVRTNGLCPGRPAGRHLERDRVRAARCGTRRDRGRGAAHGAGSLGSASWLATTKSGCPGPRQRRIAVSATRSSVAASPISSRAMPTESPRPTCHLSTT